MSIKHKTSIVLTNVKSQSRSLTVFFSLPDKKKHKGQFWCAFFYLSSQSKSHKYAYLFCSLARIRNAGPMWLTLTFFHQTKTCRSILVCIFEVICCLVNLIMLPRETILSSGNTIAGPRWIINLGHLWKR